MLKYVQYVVISPGSYREARALAAFARMSPSRYVPRFHHQRPMGASSPPKGADQVGEGAPRSFHRAILRPTISRVGGFRSTPYYEITRHSTI